MTVGKDEFGTSFSWDSHEFPFKRSAVSYNVLSERTRRVRSFFFFNKNTVVLNLFTSYI